MITLVFIKNLCYNTHMKKTVLEITDEVNCRFHNLDILTRRKLVDEVSFFLDYARHTPAFKLGRWDGKVRFCDIGGRSYINLLDRLLPIVQNQGYDVELVDNRVPTQFEFQAVKEDSYSHIVWPDGHNCAGEPIVLRDYQVEVINEFLANPQGVQKVSTGAGKTVVTAILSHKIEPYGRSLVIEANSLLDRLRKTMQILDWTLVYSLETEKSTTRHTRSVHGKVWKHLTRNPNIMIQIFH